MSQTIILKHDGASRLWIRFGQSRFVRSFNLRCFSKLPPKVAPFNHENGNDLFMEPRAKLANLQLQDKAGESHYSKITKAY